MPIENNGVRLNRRTVLGGAAATLSTLAVGSACRAAPSNTPKGGNSPGQSSKKSGGGATTTVNYWDWWVTQAPWVKNEINLFQKANPGITVNRTLNATGTYFKLFSLAQRSGKSPDVFMIDQSTQTWNQQVSEGWIAPLNKYADSAWIHQLPPDSFAEGSNMIKSKIYSAPFAAPSPSFQLYVNNKVFRDAGLVNSDGSVKVPKTWDDMTRAAETITQKSNGSVSGFGFGNSSFDILGWWTDVMVRPAGSPGGSGGQDLRTGKYVFSTDRNYTDWINLLLEWKNKGYFYPSSLSISDEISRAYFERGRFGMTVGGVWNQPEWTQHKFTDYSLTTLVGPDPQPKGYFYSTPGGINWGISPQAGNAEAAWKWLSWLYSPEAGKRWTQQYNEDLSIYPQNNDPSTIKFKPFADYVALRNDIIAGPAPAVRNNAISQVVVEGVTPNYAATLTGIYSGQIKDVASALQTLDQKSEAALNKGLSQAKAKGAKVSRSDYVFTDWDITKPYKYQMPKYPS